VDSYAFQCGKDYLQLNWVTTQEVNNRGFGIFRSEANTNHFVQTGFVKGAGNSSTEKKYSITDKNIRKGVDYFYQLRQVDLDGHPSYSSVQRGRINEDGKFDMVISPNPVMNDINISLNGLSKESFTIILSDMTGKTVSTQTYSNTAASKSLRIDMENMIRGIYVIKVLQNNNVLTQKVMKQ